MIYLRFIADGGFISRVIGLRTDGKPSHVEYLRTDDAGNPISTFGSRSDGVKHRPYDYCKPSWEEWYTFPGIEASYARALLMDGNKYDWSDIFVLWMGWNSAQYDPAREICSVLVGYSNREAWAHDEAPVLINPSIATKDITPELLYGAVTNMIKKVK